MCQLRISSMLYYDTIEEKEITKLEHTYQQSTNMRSRQHLLEFLGSMSQGARLWAPYIGDFAVPSKEQYVLLSCYISDILLARSAELRWHDEFQMMDFQRRRGCHQRQGISLPCGCVTVHIIGRLILKSWCCVFVDVIKT
jgi:hypothetical protein